MNAPAPRVTPQAGASEAVIVGAEIAAGHDGSAELALSVQHQNGVVSVVVLDQAAGLDVMRACGAASLDGLIGRSWRDVVRNLPQEQD
jgi:hypothetical protein